jgi:hypothetical protein
LQEKKDLDHDYGEFGKQKKKNRAAAALRGIFLWFSIDLRLAYTLLVPMRFAASPAVAAADAEFFADLPLALLRRRGPFFTGG